LHLADKFALYVKSYYKGWNKNGKSRKMELGREAS
jgi:hypothetical protein